MTWSGRNKDLRDELATLYPHVDDLTELYHLLELPSLGFTTAPKYLVGCLTEGSLSDLYLGWSTPSAFRKRPERLRSVFSHKSDTPGSQLTIAASLWFTGQDDPLPAVCASAAINALLTTQPPDTVVQVHRWLLASHQEDETVRATMMDLARSGSAIEPGDLESTTRDILGDIYLL
jgi:hypothetical protein